VRAICALEGASGALHCKREFSARVGAVTTGFLCVGLKGAGKPWQGETGYTFVSMRKPSFFAGDAGDASNEMAGDSLGDVRSRGGVWGFGRSGEEWIG